MKNTAIIVAAGSGSRMNSNIPKQYIEVNGKPILYYTLFAFQQSFMDDIILVVPAGDEDYCRNELVKKYSFNKVRTVIAGGTNRYDSVYKGLVLADSESYVYIHDGARPFIKEDLLRRLSENAMTCKACVAAVPVKDTIKVSDDEGYALDTPDRSRLWSIQTPQVFEYSLIKSAYDSFLANDASGLQVTDDAMLVEHMTDTRVKLVMGDYTNIKITTPEDLIFAEANLK